MPEFTIETGDFRQALATALPFVSDDEDLELLHVVRVEPGEAGTVEVAATDRFALSIETLPVAGGEPFAVSIPADVAERLLDIVLPDPVPGTVTTITRSGTDLDGYRVTITVTRNICATGHACDTTVSFTDPTGFVDYRKLVGKLLQAEPTPAAQIAFNPMLLARAAEAFADRNTDGTPLTMRFRGALGGVLIEKHDLKVLAMPARLAADAPPVPATASA